MHLARWSTSKSLMLAGQVLIALAVINVALRVILSQRYQYPVEIMRISDLRSALFGLIGVLAYPTGKALSNLEIRIAQLERNRTTPNG